MTLLTALGRAMGVTRVPRKKESFSDFDSSPMFRVDKRAKPGEHVQGIDDDKQCKALRVNPVAPPSSPLEYHYGDWEEKKWEEGGKATSN